MQLPSAPAGARIVAVPLLLFSLALAAPPLYGDAVETREIAPGVEAELQIDWRSGESELAVVCELQPQRRLTPSLRSECLQRIERLLPEAFIQTISPLPISSERSIGDYLTDHPEFTGALSSLARNAVRDRTFFSRELSRFEAVYRFNLYPELITPLITHQRAASPQPLLEYVPTGNYSGIVLYVEQSLPLFGTPRQVPLQHALFPQVLDEELTPLIDRSMLAPETLRKRGMLAYYRSDQLEQLPSRVGEVPYYTSAQAIFGVHHTDLIVSERAARRLRASDHMFELIREGKIAIVIDTATR